MICRYHSVAIACFVWKAYAGLPTNPFLAAHCNASRQGVGASRLGHSLSDLSGLFYCNKL